jgi:hypothetical protein
VRLSPLGTLATGGPVVPAPADMNAEQFWQQKLEYSEETRPSATLTTINPT